ncbi:DNA-binding protein [Burkholderia cepacia]|uniref:helix-turn-helix transcriptional regulator n=1 Tax=Burkholderia cepacia TaxID=292 RepID=UPI000F592826|nr:helix-turn-helix domain-containing protein [Burkholderia cepacia]RQT43151.1 DNA-binding protein [Burkholderia cepacia]
MHTPLQSTPPAKLYKVRYVMSLLSISKTTVYRLVDAGKLCLVKLGTRSSYITAESVDALLEQLKQQKRNG